MSNTNVAQNVCTRHRSAELAGISCYYVWKREMNLIIEALFAPLQGKAAWSVRHTHGSCFFIEFGAPHLVTREPLPTNEAMSSSQRLKRMRRRMSFRGDWSLLLYTCNWSLRAWELFADSFSSPSEMALPFEGLDGQYLKSVQYDTESKLTILTFDLGAELRLWPNEASEEREPQWSLCSIAGIHSSFLLSGELDVTTGDAK